MPTPAQEAFAEGFAALASVHGNTWTFGAASFAGVASPLQPDDPRLLGAPDRLFALTVLTSSLPATRPVRGSELTQGGAVHRVTRVDDEATGLTVFLLAPA